MLCQLCRLTAVYSSTVQCAAITCSSIVSRAVACIHKALLDIGRLLYPATLLHFNHNNLYVDMDFKTKCVVYSWHAF